MWREKGIKTATVTEESHCKVSRRTKDREKTSESKLNRPRQEEPALDSCASCTEPTSTPRDTQVTKKATTKADEARFSFNVHALTSKRNRIRSFLSRPHQSVRPPRHDVTGDDLYRSLPRRIQPPLELGGQYLQNLSSVPVTHTDTEKRKLKLEDKLDLSSRVNHRPSVWFPPDTQVSMRNATQAKCDDETVTSRMGNSRNSAAVDTTTYSCSKDKNVPHLINSCMSTLREQTISSNSSQNRHSEEDFVGEDTKHDLGVAENKPWICYSFKDFATLPTEVLEVMTCADESKCSHDHSRYRVVGDKIYIRPPDILKNQKKPTKRFHSLTLKRGETIQSSKKTQCVTVPLCDIEQQVASTQTPSKPCIVEHRDISTEISNINIANAFTNTPIQPSKLSEKLELTNDLLATASGLNVYRTNTLSKCVCSKKTTGEKSAASSKTPGAKQDCNTNEQCSHVTLPEDPKKEHNCNRCMGANTGVWQGKSTTGDTKSSQDSQIAAPPTGYHIRDDTSPSEAVSHSFKCTKNLTIKIPMSAQQSIKITGDLKEETTDSQNVEKILEIEKKKDEIVLTTTKDSKQKTTQKVKKSPKKDTGGKKTKKPKVMIIGKLNYNVSKNLESDNEKCIEKNIQHQAIKMTQMIKNTKLSFDYAKQNQTIASADTVCHLSKKQTSLISNKKELMHQEPSANYFPLKQNMIYQYYNPQNSDINSKKLKAKSKPLKMPKQSYTRKHKPTSTKKSKLFDDKLNTNCNAGKTPEACRENVIGQNDLDNTKLCSSTNFQHGEKEPYTSYVDFDHLPSLKDNSEQNKKDHYCQEDKKDVDGLVDLKNLECLTDEQLDDTICFSITSSIKNILEILEENPKSPAKAADTDIKEEMIKETTPCENNRNLKLPKRNGPINDSYNAFMIGDTPIIENQTNTQNVVQEQNAYLSQSAENIDVLSLVLSETPPKNDEEVEVSKSFPGESGDFKVVSEATLYTDAYDTDKGLVTEEIASKTSNGIDKEDNTNKYTSEVKTTNLVENVVRNLTFIKDDRKEASNKKINNEYHEVETMGSDSYSLQKDKYNLEPRSSENDESFRYKDKKNVNIEPSNDSQMTTILNFSSRIEDKIVKKCNENTHFPKEMRESNFLPLYANLESEKMKEHNFVPLCEKLESEKTEEIMTTDENDLSKKEKQLKSKAKKRKRKPKKKFTAPDNSVETKDMGSSPPYESSDAINEIKNCVPQKPTIKKLSSKLSQNLVNIKDVIDKKNLDTAAIINQCTEEGCVSKNPCPLGSDDIGDKIRSMVEQKVKALIDTYNIKGDKERDESYIKNLNHLKAKILQRSADIDTKKSNKISQTIRDRSESFLKSLKNKTFKSPNRQQSPPSKPRAKSLLPVSLMPHSPRFRSLQPHFLQSETGECQSPKKESLQNEPPRIRSFQFQSLRKRSPQRIKLQRDESPQNMLSRNQSPHNQSPRNQPSYNQSPRNQRSYNQSPRNQPSLNQSPRNQPSLNQSPRNQPSLNQSPHLQSPQNQSPRDQSPKDKSPQEPTVETKATSLLSQNPRYRSPPSQSSQSKANTGHSEQSSVTQSPSPATRSSGQQSKTTSPNEHSLRQTTQPLSTQLQTASPESGYMRSRILRTNTSLGCKSEDPEAPVSGHKSQSQETVGLRSTSESPQRQTVGFTRSFRSVSPRHKPFSFKSSNLRSQNVQQHQNSLYGSISPVTNSPFLKRQRNKTVGSVSPNPCFVTPNAPNIEDIVGQSAMSSGISVNSSTMTIEPSISESTSCESRSISSSERDYSCIPTLPEPPTKSNFVVPLYQTSNTASLNPNQSLPPKSISPFPQSASPRSKHYHYNQTETPKENQQKSMQQKPQNRTLGRSSSLSNRSSSISPQTPSINSRQSTPNLPTTRLSLKDQQCKHCLPPSSTPITHQQQQVTQSSSSEPCIKDSFEPDCPSSDIKFQTQSCLPEPDPIVQQQQSDTSNETSLKPQVPNSTPPDPPNTSITTTKSQPLQATSPKCSRTNGPLHRQIQSLQNRLFPSRQNSPSTKHPPVKHSYPVSKCSPMRRKVSMSNTSISPDVSRLSSKPSKSSGCLSPITESQSPNSQKSNKSILNVSPATSDVVLEPKEQDSAICQSQMSSVYSMCHSNFLDPTLSDLSLGMSEVSSNLPCSNNPGSQNDKFSSKTSSPLNKSQLPLSKFRKSHAYKPLRQSSKVTASVPIQESKDVELPKSTGDTENDIKSTLPVPDCEVSPENELNKPNAKTQLKEKRLTQPRKLAWGTKPNQEVEKTKVSKDNRPASKKKKRYFIVKAEKAPPEKMTENTECKVPVAPMLNKTSVEPHNSKNGMPIEKQNYFDKENYLVDSKTVQFSERVETCEPVHTKKKRYRELKKTPNKCGLPRSYQTEVRVQEVNAEEQRFIAEAAHLTSPHKAKKKVLSWDNLPDSGDEKDDTVLEGWKTDIEDEHFDDIKEDKLFVVSKVPQEIEQHESPKENHEKKPPKSKKKKKDSKKVAYNKKIKNNFKSKTLDFISKERIRVKGSPVDIKQIIEGSSVDGPTYSELYEEKEETISGQHVFIHTSNSGNEKLIKCVSKYSRCRSPEEIKELSKALKSMNKKGRIRIESSVDPAPKSRSRSRSPRTKKIRSPSNKKLKSPPVEYDLYDIEEKYQVQESISLREHHHVPLKEYTTPLRDYNMPLKEYSAPIKQYEPRHIPETFSKHRIQSSPLPLEKPWSHQADQQKGHKKKSSQEKMPDNMTYSLSVPHWNRPKIKWERKSSRPPPVLFNNRTTNRQIMLQSPAKRKETSQSGLCMALNSVVRRLSVNLD